MADRSQKFIARNRAPRVQIEYDVELYGAEKKVQLPFVMGVMSDLLGKSKAAQPAIADRKFLEIDVDNFDQRMKSMAPRAAFSVPNTLTGEGNLSIDLTFESMKDFTPGAIAAKIDSLRPLLEARTQLQTLMAYMDGKSGAEALIEKILQTPALLSSLSGADAGAGADQAAALASLQDVQVSDAAVVDATVDVLADLATKAPSEQDQTDDTADVLSELAAPSPAVSEIENRAAEVLGALAEVEPVSANDADDRHEAALANLASQTDLVTSAVEDVDQSAILDGLATQETDPAVTQDLHSDALKYLAEQASENAGEPPESDAEEALSGAIGSLPVVADTSEPEEDLDAVLAGLEDPDPASDVEQNHDSEDAVLATLSDQEQPATSQDDIEDLLGGLANEISAETDARDDLETVLDGLSEATAVDMDEGDSASAALDDILGGLPSEVDSAPQPDDLADILDGLDMPEVEVAEGADTDETLEDLLGDLTAPEVADDAEGDSDPTFDDTTLDDLLADLEGAPTAQDSGAAAGTGAEIEADLDDLLADETPTAEDDLELDDLLGDLDLGDDSDGDEDGNGGQDDKDARSENAELDDLLADLAGSEANDDLDDLLGDLNPTPADTKQEEASNTNTQAAKLTDPAFAYGTISAARPEAQNLQRRRFRMALFGDFSGRAARGVMQTGADLAMRPAILLDPDTVEEIIAGFGDTLVLPVGETGGVAVKLGELDDLHPDELFESVEIFSELVSLRKQLQNGGTVEHASRTLKAWAEQYGTPVRLPKRQSAGSAVPADRRLSAFQQLIGDSQDALRQASPIEDMLARVVGPHIRALPDPDVAAMISAVDAALSDAMRMVLHHPEFQSLEAQWRTLDLIARSVETDDSLEVMLYDVSAEELAVDLAAQDDLTESGLVQLLTEEPMDPDLGRGGYSALIGLYKFEETPPHAELLGRLARVAAHVDAPFVAGLSPEFLQIAKEDRPKLVAEAWETLQAMPEAGHLGLASPSFLLRRPYGAKSDPIDAFDFEEFSESEGLKGMLWANPVALVAILLARSFKANGPSLQLGSVMSLGGMPYHYVTDQFGDQVALPCTERNIDLDKIAMANARGVMAVSAVKGRDELRLTSFLSVAGAQILGPWTGMPAPAPSPDDPRKMKGPAKPLAADTEGDTDDPDLGDMTSESPDLDDLDLDDLGLDDLGLDDLDLEVESAEAGADDLDALLAGFGEDEAADEAGEEDDMDADLAALLADL